MIQPHHHARCPASAISAERASSALAPAGSTPSAHQVHRQPQQKAEVRQAPGDAADDQRHADRRVAAAQHLAQAGDRMLLVDERHARMGCVIRLDRARRACRRIAPARRAPRPPWPGVGKEARRLRNPAVEHDDQRARRQAQQPQHAPTEQRLEQGRRACREQIAGRRADTAQRHQQPAAMRRGNRLGHQGEGDRQQTSGRGAHQETHGQVPAERRHRAADRRADEHQRRQQDRRAATEQVAQAPPHHRTERGAGQRHQRQQGAMLDG